MDVSQQVFALRPESDDVLDALWEAFPAWVFLLNLEGRIMRSNAESRPVAGFLDEPLPGRLLLETIPTESRPYWAAYLDLLSQTPQVIRFQDQSQGGLWDVAMHPVRKGGEPSGILLILQDITAPQKDAERLYRYHQALSAVQSPMAIVDVEGCLRMSNQSFQTLLLRPALQDTAHDLRDMMDQELYDRLIAPKLQAARAGVEIMGQSWVVGTDGIRRFMRLTFHPLLTPERVVSGVVINAVDLSDHQQMQEELRRLSQTDALTRVFNRGKFVELADREIQRVGRHYTDLACILLDIDHFKRVNDTYGHDAGDRVLVEVAQALNATIRVTDSLARWGGEEFILLLPFTSGSQAVFLGEKLRLRIQGIHVDPVPNVSASFGVAQYRLGEGLDAWFKRADEALYRAKEGGRNRVELETPPEEETH